MLSSLQMVRFQFSQHPHKRLRAYAVTNGVFLEPVLAGIKGRGTEIDGEVCLQRARLQADSLSMSHHNLSLSGCSQLDNTGITKWWRDRLYWGSRQGKSGDHIVKHWSLDPNGKALEDGFSVFTAVQCRVLAYILFLQNCLKLQQQR